LVFFLGDFVPHQGVPGVGMWVRYPEIAVRFGGPLQRLCVPPPAPVAAGSD